MYVVIMIQGCVPFIYVAQDEKKQDGSAKMFKTMPVAKKWAKENCSWQYKIVKV